MKTYLKLLGVILIIPIVFSSCEDDDDTGASIVGTWEEVSFVASGCIDPTDNETFTCTSSCERIVVTNNTVTIGTNPALNYTVSGNQLSIVQSGGGVTITIVVTFEVTETSLTITQQDEAVDGGCKNVSVYKRV